MEYGNVIIEAKAALEAATEIDTAISNMRTGIDRLKSQLDLFHNDTIATWEDEFYEEWNRFYNNTYPTVEKALIGQSENLKTAAGAGEQLDVSV